MRFLGIDIETFSSGDLIGGGVHKYVSAPDFEIIWLSYAYDDEPVTRVDMTKPERPNDWGLFLNDLLKPDVVKTAYNAAFEITCMSKAFDLDLNYRAHQWLDTAVLAAVCGLPRSLDAVCKALGLSDNQQKDAAGKALIRYFSVPCKPTKSNGGRTRNLPQHAPEKWEQYGAYNAQDVVAERAVRKRLMGYIPSGAERDAWRMDLLINNRGVRVDMDLVEAAIEMSNRHREAKLAEAAALTGLSNPNSVAQLKGWLGVDSLTKQDVADMQKLETGTRKRVLELRQELSKSSVKKYEAIQNCVCPDGRVHDLFQFYGANRTGRWAGKLVQVQNLPRNYLPDLDLARQLVKKGDIEAVELLFGDVPDTLSQLIRTAFVPKEGYTFAVADFAAIEARVVAWLAGEEWRMKVFRDGGDIYCASASQMFHVPVEKHGQNAHLRQKGKIAELALGYGGSTGAMLNMGADRMGIPEAELPEIVRAWRAASPNIVALWGKVEKAAINAVRFGEGSVLPKGLEIWLEDGMMHIQLPSGRALRYYKPHMTTNKFGNQSIAYQAYDAGRWAEAETFGGKLVENIVQGIARDYLRDAMLTVQYEHPDIVMHIHDEMVVEVPIETAEEDLKAICDVMGQPIHWAPGLLLRGDGYLTDYYRKD